MHDAENGGRLTLRPQQVGDAPSLFTILSDARAMRFWSHPPVRRLAAVEELLRQQQAAMLKGPCQYWTVLEGSDAIGNVDLTLIRNGLPSWAFCSARTARAMD